MIELYTDRSTVHGTGVFASRPVEPGERIAYIAGKRVVFMPRTPEEADSIPTWYGVSKSVWIDPGNSIFQYLNHSCSPNAAIIGTKTIVARTRILAKTEITIDYSMTDVDPLWVMPCQCKSPTCRGEVRAIQMLDESVVRDHLPLIPKYFLNYYRRANPSATI